MDQFLSLKLEIRGMYNISWFQRTFHGRTLREKVFRGEIDIPLLEEKSYFKNLLPGDMVGANIPDVYVIILDNCFQDFFKTECRYHMTVATEIQDFLLNTMLPKFLLIE